MWGFCDHSDQPDERLKKILDVLDHRPLLPESLLNLIQWASDYYHYPLGQVFSTVLPNLLSQAKTTTQRLETLTLKSIEPFLSDSSTSISSDQFTLSQEQLAACNAINLNLNQFKTFFLNGVTGSGKTEVYLQVIERVLLQNKQALVLVPEISLTPQTISRFQQRFSVPLAIFHSRLTDRQRLQQWLQMATGNAKIAIGTRSALFIPMRHPGIIIIDEEHDLSFKQQEGLRYNARDLSMVRGRFEQIPVVLGSATASLETMLNGLHRRYQQLDLSKRAGRARDPKLTMIDLRNKKLVAGVSPELLTRMQFHLEAGGQVLLFLNRRGYAPVYLCPNCSWTAHCDDCDHKMTLHRNPMVLCCHYCSAQKPLTLNCPRCQKEAFIALGVGTQRLEEVLRQQFPNDMIIRIDRDNTRKKKSLDHLLNFIHTGQPCIMIGTQMLAKGHHFPNVRLVGILNADHGLFSSDFRAPERVAQLMVQVSGRAGRGAQPGEVLIQTYYPQHPLLMALMREGYPAFVTLALEERKLAKLPPYAYFVLIRAESKQIQCALDFLIELKKINAQGVAMLGPVKSPLTRRAGYCRAQLLLQSSKRSALHAHVDALVAIINVSKFTKKVRWSIDVDPLEME